MSQWLWYMMAYDYCFWCVWESECNIFVLLITFRRSGYYSYFLHILISAQFYFILFRFNYQYLLDYSIDNNKGFPIKSVKFFTLQFKFSNKSQVLIFQLIVFPTKMPFGLKSLRGWTKTTTRVRCFFLRCKSRIRRIITRGGGRGMYCVFQATCHPHLVFPPPPPARCFIQGQCAL